MSIPDVTIAAPTYNCREDRHKVITPDGICCLCGARDVVDARTLAPPPDHLPPTPLITVEQPDDRATGIASRLIRDTKSRRHIGRLVATEPDGGAEVIRMLLRHIDRQR